MSKIATFATILPGGSGGVCPGCVSGKVAPAGVASEKYDGLGANGAGCHCQPRAPGPGGAVKKSFWRCSKTAFMVSSHWI